MIQHLYSTDKETWGEMGLARGPRGVRAELDLRLLASTGSPMGTWLQSLSQYVSLRRCCLQGSMEGSLHFPALTRKNLLPPQDSALSKTFSLWSPMSSPAGQLHLHGSMAAPSIHPRYAGILPPQHSPWPPLAKFDSFQSNLIPLLTRVHALLTPLLGLL